MWSIMSIYILCFIFTYSLISRSSVLETSSEADLVAFVQEIEMMKFIGKHENVVQLYATTSYKGKLGLDLF